MRHCVLAALGVFGFIFSSAAAESNVVVRPATWAKAAEIKGVPNLHKISDRLYRSAQPTAEGFRNLKDFGIKTVVSLRSFSSDRKALKAAGLDYHRIYMKAWHPEKEDIIEFLRLATDESRGPVLVHCQQGADRTGVMCAAYRVAVQNWTKEQALKEMTEGGYSFHGIWRNLVKWFQKLDIEDVKKAAGLTTATPVLLTATASAQWKFPCEDKEIAGYTAYHVREKIKIDGRLDERAWQQAPKSPRFVDIITGEPAMHDTRATVLWDDQNLYVGFRVEEPHVQAKYTNHNDPIYYDNDVEVFIAGRDAYYEFEINGLNTVYEAFFIWQDAYEAGGFAHAPAVQPGKLKPFNGVGFKTHPRGPRLGAFDWTFPGRRSAVFIDGTLNSSADHDRGWTVELAFPWKGMEWLAKSDHRPLPPKNGDVWRMDFSRFNTYKAPQPAKDSGGWVWTRHGIWDSHIPECFVQVHFATNDVAGRK